MRIRVTPGRRLAGTVSVPGDKSIAHRWLMLAATAEGTSSLVDLPGSLDVRSTASCLASITSAARPALEGWASKRGAGAKGHGSTWNVRVPDPASTPLEVEGEGRDGLVPPGEVLDCGNSGSSIRMLAGVLAAAPFRSVLTGDESLRTRPMERVAAPLRRMGATMDTTDGTPPVTIEGGGLAGILEEMQTPTAQVKTAILLAGLDAEGPTTVVEPAATRDHTERAIRALGGPALVEGPRITVSRFQHAGFAGRVPGDASSAAFLVAAAAVTGSELTLRGVGLNPSRTAYLDVMARMGVRTQTRVEAEVLGEPVGDLWVAPCEGLAGARVEPSELPLVVDEVPVLAALAAHARGDSWFLGAGELRLKESDRLSAIVDGIRALGGHAATEGDDLVLAGGGIDGGATGAMGDHRIAMALAVSALAAERPVEIDGMEVAAVSFPGFGSLMRSLGADIEQVRA
jgi:3-phosphoshikimate 1-carboxyvinyltransferase